MFCTKFSMRCLRANAPANLERKRHSDDTRTKFNKLYTINTNKHLKTLHLLCIRNACPYYFSLFHFIFYQIQYSLWTNKLHCWVNAWHLHCNLTFHLKRQQNQTTKCAQCQVLTLLLSNTTTFSSLDACNRKKQSQRVLISPFSRV